MTLDCLTGSEQRKAGNDLNIDSTCGGHSAAIPGSVCHSKDSTSKTQLFRRTFMS